MTITLPEDLRLLLTEEEVRLELSIALYRREVVTLRQAARVAHLDQFAFRRVLAEREVPLNISPQDVDRDLSDLAEWRREGR